MIHNPPLEIAGDASFDGQEYGWKLSRFHIALAAAERLEFACLGGQLQFRIKGSIFEMHWLSADASDRLRSEFWSNYVQRSCREVALKFAELLANLDVRKVIQEWPTLSAMLTDEINPCDALVFVAYFVTQKEFQNLPALKQPAPED